MGSKRGLLFEFGQKRVKNPLAIEGFRSKYKVKRLK